MSAIVPEAASGRVETTVLGFPQIAHDRELKTGGLRVAIEVRKDSVLVALTGPLDIYTVPGFRRHVDPFADAGDQIVIDLTGVTLIDSAGLGALVSLRNQAHRDGPGSLGLVCPQRHLLRVFEITGLRRAFSFGPTVPPPRPRPAAVVSVPDPPPTAIGAAAGDARAN
jgi:anti-anti-sigma factor